MFWRPVTRMYPPFASATLTVGKSTYVRVWKAGRFAGSKNAPQAVHST
jgi:hypothetical protein